MKFAFSANAFRRYSIRETIDLVADLGYRGIEIMADVPHAFPAHLSARDVADLRRAIEGRGLEVSNLNAFMHHADGDTYHPTWIEPQLELRRKRIDYTLACIDLAAELGAGTLSTEPGGPLEGMSEARGLELFLEGLRAVEKRARARKVRVLIEPEPGLLIENSRQFLALSRHLDPRVFGLNFDIGHFFCVGEDPCALVPDLMPFISHFHLEDIAANRVHHHLMLGEGAIDIASVLRTIRGTGFAGFVTVELYTYEDQPDSAARRAIEYLSAWERANPPSGIAAG
jgi:sugar phosphate isomerase/epimerase